jgi:hypothetical protein
MSLLYHTRDEMRTLNLPDNKWTRIYLALINRAALRQLTNEYCEKHHIIPKSIGGSNDEENMVLLTAREHLVAHKLLVKIFQQCKHSRKKMLAGLWAMASLRKDNRRIKLNSREFEKLRIDYFNSRKGMSPQQHTRDKIAQSLKGRKIPLDVIEKRNKTKTENILKGITKIVRKKLSDEEKILRKQRMKKRSAEEKKATSEKSKLTKQNWSQETKDAYSKKLSESNRGKKRTKEQRAKISESLMGRVVSETTRKNISQAQKGKKRGAHTPFHILSPSGEIIIWVDSIQDFSEQYKVPIKYLYLSRKNNSPIKRGPGAGWQLL